MSDEPAECPLCMEALEIDDHSFFPCTCGYQICRFCWHRIRTDENGLCPACRKQYPEDPAEFKPLTEDELQNIKKERKQKDVQRKQKAAENRKHLANVRVVQRNLVFVVGLSPRLADPEVLKKPEYFGKFGKIHKVVINQSTSYAGSQGPSASAYVTYLKPEDALRAILTVNNIHVEGRTLKTSLGTTKYCSHFLKGSHCQKNDCMYLHELGEEAASFTKDEMQAGKHQEYEQMLIEQFLNAQNSANNHVISNSKLKKSISPQVIDNPDAIPSLLDMTGDIKHVTPHSGPLLPNPVVGITSNGHTPSQGSHWPLLESSGSPAPGGGGSKLEQMSSNNNRPQNGKSQHRTNTPPGSGGSLNGGTRPVGAGRHKVTNSGSNSDDGSHIHSQTGSVSSLLSSSPEDNEIIEVVSSVSPQPSTSMAPPGLPLPTPVSQTSPLSSPMAGNSTSPTIPTMLNGLSTQQIPLSQAAQSEQNSMNSLVGAIGSNRRSLLSEGNSNPGLSFISNSLLNPPSYSNSKQQQVADVSPTQDMPSLTLPSQELSDSLPVTTNDYWSSGFSFKNTDMSQDDDLGFDPCAESFKGLADLMEKENGLMMNKEQQSLQPGLSSPQAGGCLNNSPPQSSFLSSPHPGSPLQNNTHTPMRSLPPGFSMSHIQQQHLQQQQQFFRSELPNSSKVLDFLPPFGQPSQQRFNTLPSYHSMPMDLHTQQQQQQQPGQRDPFAMKDMQEQLRSMLPNINISFGSIPHQQAQQQPQPQQFPLHQNSTSLHSIQHNHLNKSWPLSNSPETNSPWNDPAIVSTSQLPDPLAENAPHWLKSLQQLTESDGPSHRLPFVQQFPMVGTGGWPPHPHNPPPGFRMTGIPAQQNSENSHQMAEVLQ